MFTGTTSSPALGFGKMDSATKKPARKKLGELLIEAGIVKAEELPKGLEFAQKATDGDLQSVSRAKDLIDNEGLSVPTALRALSLSKQKHCELDQALTELGWRAAKPTGFQDGRPVKSKFTSEELDVASIQKSTSENRKLLWKAKTAQDAGMLTESGTFKTPGTVARDEEALRWASEHLGGEAPASQTFQNLKKEAMSSSPYSSPEMQFSMPDPTPPPMPAINPGAIETPDFDLERDTFSGSPRDFGRAVQAGDKYFSEHNYEQSEMYYRQALEFQERTANRDSLVSADLLIKIGRSCLQISAFTKAEDSFCRALRLREEKLGKDDIAIAECLDYLAELYDIQSQYLEAEQYYLSALGIKERLLDPSSQHLSSSLKKLVAVSKRRGVQPEERLSGQLLTEAGIVDSAHLEEGLSIANERELPIGRALISLNYLNEGDLESVLQAQLLLREGVVPGYLAVRALRLASQQQISLKDALREIGLEPDDTSTNGAFQLLQAAQELLDKERELTPEHPDLVALCMKLGDLYTDNNRYQQAEKLYRRAISIAEKLPEGDREQKAHALSRLGNLQYRLQNFAEAEAIYVDLLDVWESLVGPQDSNFVTALESLAAVKYVRNDYKEAGRLYQLAINAKEAMLGPEHPGLASALQGRANCYFAVQRYGEAEQLYRRAISIYEKVYGPHNEQIAALANIIGDLFYAQGQLDAALYEYSQGLDALSNSPNPDIWLFTSILDKMAHSYFEQGDFVRADAYYRHFFQTRQSCGSAGAPDMIDKYERYAIVLDNLERYEDASAMRHTAMSMRVPS